MSTATFPLPRPQQRDPVAVFLVFSLLLHLLLVLFFPLPAQNFLAPEPEQLTEVELLPPEEPEEPKIVAKAELPPVAEQAKPPEPPKEEAKQEKEKEPPPPPLPEQIVNPPDEVNDQVPERTRFLSDRNTTAKEETVAVGSPLPADNPEKPKKEEEKKTEPKKQPEPQKEPVKLAAVKPPVERSEVTKPPVEKTPQKALREKMPKTAKPGTPNAPKRVPQLFARPDDLLTEGFIQDRGREQEQQHERRAPTGNELLAMAPPKRSLFSLPGARGTPDHLPDVRQGKMTFLNTKAHRFAPFVRRVAQRVFQHLVIDQRRNLQLDDVIAAKDWVTIEAKMTTQGELIGLVLRSRSGSYSIDESLLHACENGAWDQNPPSEAQAEDGLIHFIFRSDINAQYDSVGLKAVVTFLQVGLT